MPPGPRNWISRFRHRGGARPARHRRLSRPLQRTAGLEWLEQRLALTASVQVRFEFTDLADTPLTAITVGEDFRLKVYVKDIRENAQGLFQAYLDVGYPQALATPNGSIVHGPAFSTATFGDTNTPGLIDETGGIDTDQVQPSPGNVELLLFSVPFHANTDGDFDLVPNLAQASQRRIVLWELSSGTPLSDIQFVGASIDINLSNIRPTLTDVDTLTGAIEDTEFLIDYATLADAANEFDPDSSPISFRVESVTAGSLTKGGTPVSPGATLLSPGESWVWTPPEDANGLISAFDIRAFDGNSASLAAVTTMIDVTAINDAPSFVPGPGQWRSAAGAVTVPGWATDISPGPADEAGQEVTFEVSTDNDAMFSDVPSISSDGTLTYTVAPSESDMAKVTVVLTDNGAPFDTDQNTSPEYTFYVLLDPDERFWHNPFMREDVDRNGAVQPLDALQVINRLILFGTHELPAAPAPPDGPPPFVDVNDDGFLFPIDALIVINYLILNNPPANPTAATASPASASQISAVDYELRALGPYEALGSFAAQSILNASLLTRSGTPLGESAADESPVAVPASALNHTASDDDARPQSILDDIYAGWVVDDLFDGAESDVGDPLTGAQIAESGMEP